MKPLPPPITAGSACNNAKKRDKKEGMKKKRIGPEGKTNPPQPRQLTSPYTPTKCPTIPLRSSDSTHKTKSPA